MTRAKIWVMSQAWPLHMFQLSSFDLPPVKECRKLNILPGYYNHQFPAFHKYWSMTKCVLLLYPDQLLIRSKSLQGLPLLLKKTSALFIKRFHHTRRDVRGFIAQVLLPVLFVTAAMGLGTLRTKETEYPELILSPSLYGTSDQADFFGWVVVFVVLKPICL